MTKADVLAASDGTAAPDATEKVLRGPAGMLAKAMDESRSIPTATSFRTIAVDTLDAKRKGLNAALAERGMKVSFTHLVAWAIVLAARKWPVMATHFEERDGKLYAIDDGTINLGIAVDVERKDGSRSLMVPAIKGADGMDFSAFHTYYEDLITKTRENRLTPDDFVGTNITLTNPGGIGTVASVPRLMTGQGTMVAAGSIAYPPEWVHADPARIESLGVSKVMTLTSTYDHRIIQGAESGNFLKDLEGLLFGDDEFYESVATELDLDPSVLAASAPKAESAPPLAAGVPPQPSAIAGAPDPELLQAVQGATSLLKAFRTHGHLAAELDPLGRGPMGDPALDPETVALTPELMSQIPASILRIGVPGETLLEALPRMRIGLHRHHRLSVRAHLLPSAAGLDAGDDRDRRPSQAARARGAEAAARTPDRGLRIRALHREGLPRSEDVLDRGSRFDRADDRRAEHARGPRAARARS